MDASHHRPAITERGLARTQGSPQQYHKPQPSLPNSQCPGHQRSIFSGYVHTWSPHFAPTIVIRSSFYSSLVIYTPQHDCFATYLSGSNLLGKSIRATATISPTHRRIHTHCQSLVARYTPSWYLPIPERRRVRVVLSTTPHDTHASYMG